jgi:hypothetical protein
LSEVGANHVGECPRLHPGRRIDKDVTFLDTDPDINDAIDAAYRDKYCRYGAATLDRINSPEARSTTIQLVPRSTGSQRALGLGLMS